MIKLNINEITILTVIIIIHILRYFSFNLHQTTSSRKYFSLVFNF